MSEIAIAFDVGTLDEALALDERLGSGPEVVKIGLQLFTAAGPGAVRALRDRGRRIFLDLKLHDIPNTVRGAASAAAALGAELLTVHATGGEAMVRAAVAGAGPGLRVIAVSVLTSLDPRAMPPGFARPFELEAEQSALLELAERAGAAGIVCSAADLPGLLRRRQGRAFFAVTPGIRPAGGESHDQRRVATIAEAVRLGAGMIVLGRAITGAADPRAALEAARRERDEALRRSRGLDIPGGRG
ncbi:MAG TPA: orotidine-5'-phosphate decarboxylase [Terriglobales bacterium]|nr:orotidine-5'-phosphate decarboxylase [Terriglobales bacterium]